MPVFFNGRLFITPTNASMVDDAGMFNRNLSVGNIAAQIGKAYGGAPNTVLRFGSPEEARAVLVGPEETIKAVEKAFDPSSETAGPSELVFIRIDPATQSTLTLLDASSGQSIVLTSTDYGARTEQIKVKIESGTVRGKKLTTQFGDAYFTEDNVGRDVFSVQYTGDEVSASVDITGTDVTLTYGSQTPVVISLAAYDTVQKLVDRINAIPGFVAEVQEVSGDQPTLNALDFATTVSVKTSAVIFKADLQACVNWFNGLTEQFVNAERSDGAGAPPANIGFTYLSGGSNGSATNSDWQAGYDVLQGVDVQWVTPLSSSASIHAMNDTHCAYMSTVAMKERRSICGTALGTTDDAAKTAAKALNSDRTSLVHLGFYDYDQSGKLMLFPPYVLAALIGGMFSGVNPGTALTNKSIKVRGLERKLRNPTDTDQLILGGVLCVEDTDAGFKVVQSITTWLNNSNFNRREQSVGFACDFTVRNVRKAVDPTKGKKGTPLTLADAKRRAASALDELSRPEPMGPGVLVGDADNPPWRKLEVSLQGDVIRIQYEASPVIPANYILQVAHMLPYSGSV